MTQQDRLTSKYSNRLRRLIDRMGKEVETLRTEVTAIGTGLTTVINITISGTTSENAPSPTSGAQLFICVNQDDGGVGDHTVNADFYNPHDGVEYSKVELDLEGQYIWCIGATYDSNLKWFALLTNGATLIV